MAHTQNDYSCRGRILEATIRAGITLPPNIDVNVGRHQGGNLPLRTRGGGRDGHDLIQLASQLHRIVGIGFSAVRASPDLLFREFPHDSIPCLFEPIGIEQVGFIQMGKEPFDFLTSDQDTSPISHQRHLDIPDRCCFVQQDHEAIRVEVDSLPLRHQPEVIADQDELPPLVRKGNEFNITPYGW